eukprot:gene2114-biopygen22958
MLGRVGQQWDLLRPPALPGPSAGPSSELRRFWTGPRHGVLSTPNTCSWHCGVSTIICWLLLLFPAVYPRPAAFPVVVDSASVVATSDTMACGLWCICGVSV